MASIASPDIARNSLKTDLVVNIGSQLILRAVLALCTLYAAREMGPRQFGIWAVLQVVFLYTMQAHLGTANAMMREVPIARAQHREGDAQRIANATWSFVTLVSVPTALLAGGLTAVIYRNEYAHLWPVVLGSTWLVLVQLQSAFFHYWSRAFLAFKKLALVSLIQAAISFPLCLWLIPRFGIAGYLFVLAAGFTVTALVIVFGTPSRPRLGMFVADWKKLLVLGLPILPGTLVLNLNIAVERIVLASTMGAAAVGMFAAAAFFFQTGAAMWELSVYTWYPRLAARYGRTGSVESVVGMLRGILPGLLWLTSIAQGLLFLLLPPLIYLLLPKYTAAITTAQVMVLALNAYGVAHLLVYSLNIVGRQHRALGIQAIALAVKAIAILAVVVYAKELLFVSVACVFGCMVYVVLGWLEWRHRADVGTSGYLGLCWAAPTLVVVASWHLTRQFPLLPRSCIAAAIFFTAIGILTLLVERRNTFISKVWTWRTAE